MLINHVALEELDPVHDLINWSKVEKHLSHIHAKKLGEKAWPSNAKSTKLNHPQIIFKLSLKTKFFASV